MPVKLCPAEEMIWSKAYVQERERFDGADIAHLIRCRGEAIDWRRLLRRFGEHWRVLFGHLVLFGFIYPAERDKIPAWLLKELSDRLVNEIEGAVAARADLLRDAPFARTIPPGYRQVGLPRRPAQASGPDVTRRGRSLDRRDRRGEGLIITRRRGSAAGRPQLASSAPASSGANPLRIVFSVTHRVSRNSSK